MDEQTAAYKNTHLNSDLTFDTLVTGRANELARAAAQQVATTLGDSYNPLFVYGGVGTGKTHLIHAIGNQAYAANSTLEVRYVHSQDYVSDVARAYQQSSHDAFIREYCSLDLLLIDDIQFFNGKDRTQEEFSYVFNALVGARKQVVIAGDTCPKDVQGLEERLVSRFEQGLTITIGSPELEMRIAILRSKAAAELVQIADDVFMHIAMRLGSNVRELEGALNRVIAHARFYGCEINFDAAKEALAGFRGAANLQVAVSSAPTSP
jgi:chromosomal replication initiator protein